MGDICPKRGCRGDAQVVPGNYTSELARVGLCRPGLDVRRLRYFRSFPDHSCLGRRIRVEQSPGRCDRQYSCRRTDRRWRHHGLGRRSHRAREDALHQHPDLLDIHVPDGVRVIANLAGVAALLWRPWYGRHMDGRRGPGGRNLGRKTPGQGRCADADGPAAGFLAGNRGGGCSLRYHGRTERRRLARHLCSWLSARVDPAAGGTQNA